jgi:HAD superfamily hydrolase (TIGR01509 family)
MGSPELGHRTRAGRNSVGSTAVRSCQPDGGGTAESINSSLLRHVLVARDVGGIRILTTPGGPFGIPQDNRIGRNDVEGQVRAQEGPDLVIFDCDGVLVDSEPVVIGVLAEWMRQLGIQITNEQCMREFVGLTQNATAALIACRLGSAVPPGWFDSLTVAVDAALSTQTRAVPGVAEVLDRLTVPFCIASNGRPEKVALTLGASGLARYFEGRAFTAADVPRGKPAPDLFLWAAAHMGADPTRSVVIEDSPTGIDAARAAGMRVFGYVPDGALPLAGADRVFAAMAELPALLGLPAA